jgi:hypothetical protein
VSLGIHAAGAKKKNKPAVFKEFRPEMQKLARKKNRIPSK